MEERLMKKYTFGFWILLMMASFLATAMLALPDQVTGPSSKDMQIRREVMKKLHDEKRLTGVNATVEDGIVTLFGSVASLADRQEAEKRAKHVHGVRQVNNLINVMATTGRGDDNAILEEAIKRIRTDPFYSIYDDVNISVQDGVITLSGEVWQPARKSDYEKRLSSIPGVKQIRNELKVAPTSIMDDRLRYQLTRAIYSHPGMEKYAIQPDPPIHIIVENQRVTITGVVNSEVDKALVESIVRGFTTLGVTNNLRVESSERKKR
jgi:hyperosmotically inducible protein